MINLSLGVPSPLRPSSVAVTAAVVLLLTVAAPPRSAAQSMPGSCPLPVPTPSAPVASDQGVPEPAWDLRCIELIATAGGQGAEGVVTLHRSPSPFGVSVTPEGRHRWRLSLRVEGLPDPQSLGPYTEWVAWATPLELDPVVSLGPVRNGTVELGEIAFSKYMIWISAEASADVTERAGPLVLRGRSPSSLMEPHDLMTLAPGAEEFSAAAAAEHHGPEGAPHDSIPTEQPRGEPGGDLVTWELPPAYPGVPMLPGMHSLEPGVRPLRVAPADGSTAPPVRPGGVVTLPDGGTLDLTAGFVSATVAGREIQMLAFNGQHPGPLLQVSESSTIFVNFRNETPFPTAIHWHGLRLDNRFDGVPGVTQDPVLPGESFRYTVHFPDAGIYWYHPHHREDVAQELGLYGNMLVEPLDPERYGPANREEVLLIDDLLLDPDGVAPFGLEHANFSLMGRFGNTFLVNGQPEYALQVDRGELVRFYLTNAANTRTFNLSFQASDGRTLPMKVIGTDVSLFEREERVENAVLAPAQRYIVEVLFERPGRYELVNHVQGINHRAGVFLEERTVLGTVDVARRSTDQDHARSFHTLRTQEAVVREIDRYRDRFDAPVDRELVLSLEADDLPLVVEETMRYDWVYLHPVEWTGTMPMMNWAISGDDVRWMIREPSTGRVNDEIDWDLAVGDVVKLRIHNDRSSIHAMHHPIHIHGQRFLVIEQNGVRSGNLGWKDTVLLPPGSTTDILLEISNPGRWMVHCHIAEHLEAGMQFIFDVEGP